MESNVTATKLTAEVVRAKATAALGWVLACAWVVLVA